MAANRVIIPRIILSVIQNISAVYVVIELVENIMVSTAVKVCWSFCVNSWEIAFYRVYFDQVAKGSSRGLLERIWLMRAEKTDSVWLTNVRGTAASIAVTKNVFKWEWSGRLSRRSASETRRKEKQTSKHLPVNFFPHNCQLIIVEKLTYPSINYVGKKQWNSIDSICALKERNFSTTGMQSDMAVERILEAERRVECKDEPQIDSDGGVANICQATDKQLFQLVEWAKHIPHFTDLPLVDQVVLLRAGKPHRPFNKLSPPNAIKNALGWNELLIAAFSHRSVSVKDGIVLATGLVIHR